MWYRCCCPQCGLGVEYIQESVGTVQVCESCKRPFRLKSNDGRWILKILYATIAAAMIGLGTFLIRHGPELVVMLTRPQTETTK